MPSITTKTKKQPARKFNIAATIRDAIREHPDANNVEIADVILRRHDVFVRNQAIRTVRSAMRRTHAE